MRAVAILPVKRFAAAKTRLGDVVSDGERRELGLAMLTDVLAAIGRSEHVARTIVVTGEPAACEAAESAGVESIDDPSDAGHSEAALLGVAVAIAAGEPCAALLPGDCPLLDPAELDRALAEMEPGVAGIVPDRHGSGTNGLLLAPPDAVAPSFGPGSRERHAELARAAGAEPRVFEIASMALDLDTPEDLAALRAAVAEDPRRAPATEAALRTIS